jgi:glyoxylase-like metal-dependent hydrolase (beta-lactamase superfamily II)
MPFPGFLGYSFSYSIRVPDGVVLLDLGWDSDVGWATLELGLSRAGAEWGEVVGVVVTHTHPDHFGLVERVRARSGAWIAGHRGESANLLDTIERRVRRAAEIRMWLQQCGVPPELLEQLSSDALTVASDHGPQAFDVLLEDGESVPGSDGALKVWHTPGHTPGSICVFDGLRRLLYTGDHVLPRVTPNVSKRPGSVENPVAEHNAALRRIASLGNDVLVLPGHEWAFDRLAERAGDLLDHNAARGREVLAAFGGRASTVWQVARAISWSRPFDSLDVRGKRQALGETHAHLYDLHERAEVRVAGAAPLLWALPR